MLKVIKDKCVGCSLCVKKCPFDALEMVDGIVQVNEKCTLCGACVAACKFEALALEKNQEVKDLSGYSGVLVYIEQRKSSMLPVGLELLGEGRKLADTLGVELYAILIGHEISHHTERLVGHGADKVYYLDDELCADYRTEVYADILAESIDKIKPEIVLIGASVNGRDLAPRVSAKLSTGLTADCTKLEICPESHLLLQTRPAFGGNLMATIVCENHRPQMATVRPGIFTPTTFDANKTGQIEEVKFNFSKLTIRTQVSRFIPGLKQKVNLEEAKIIVSAGRGVGSKENLQLVQQLAEALGAELGASRAIVDAGWIEKPHQVGQTGKTVRPDLYIACGISGAIQHRAGMENSRVIVAINKDADASICKVADLSLIGDLNDVIPAILDNLSEFVEGAEALSAK